MAYAELAGLPAITGLYTSILCLVGYAVFGPSRVLVLGPDSSLGPMIAATILPLVSRAPTPRWIIVAAEPITDVDTTAADMLTDLDEGLNAGGTSLVSAEVKDPVRRKIERYQLTRTIDPQHFFPTLEAAVEAFRAETGARWEAPTVPTTGTL
jgi:MFS superfamily sulfate permease-like transporter